MPRIDVGHITLNYEERGEGPAFLFIPGLVGLLNAWEFQLAHFSKRYRCISFDHRGAGDSDKPADAYATALIAGQGISDPVAVVAALDLACASNARESMVSISG